jgi:hypothetical protein
MLKRFSRRAMRFFAVACLTLAVVCLWGVKSANTAVFAPTQIFIISGITASNLSQVCVYNISVQPSVFLGCYGAGFGSYNVLWSHPSGAVLAFYLYDHNLGRFTDFIAEAP